MLFFLPKAKENIYKFSRRKQLGAFPSSEKASYFILSFSDYHCLCILDTGNPTNIFLYFQSGHCMLHHCDQLHRHHGSKGSELSTLQS